MDSTAVSSALADINSTADLLQKARRLSGLVGALYAAEGFGRRYDVESELQRLRGEVADELNR